MRKIKLKSNAKINLGLNIIEKRTDGYHDLETIFFPLYGLHDEIIIEKSESFSLLYDAELNIEPGDNLISKAVRVLEEYCKIKFNVKITLHKNIPIGAGLGGGSSNAAFTLTGLNRLFNLGLSSNELMKLGISLGSDVPIFLLNKTALGYSRGELLKPVGMKLSAYKLFIINPGIHISTKKAFENITPKSPEIPLETIAASKDILKDLKDKSRNDFEDFVFQIYPEVKEIKDKLYSNGALYASMSGTGSTVFGFFPMDADNESLMRFFPDEYFFHIEEL